MTAGERLGRATADRPKTVLAVAAAFTMLALVFVLRLRPDTGVGNLFPSHDPATVALARWVDRFPTGGDVLVLATLPDGAPADAGPLLAFADRLSGRLTDVPGVAAVVYRLDAAARQFVERVVAPAGVYYLTDAGYAEARRRLTPDGMAAQLRQDEAMLAAPGPAAGAVAAALVRDPLHLHELLVDAMAVRRPAAGGGGAVLSPDGRSLLVRIVSHGKLGDTTANKQLVEAVTAATAATNTAGLSVDVTGGPAIAVFDATAIRRDCVVSVTASCVLMQLMFLAAYRRGVRSFAVAFVPVGLGVVWGFAVRSAVGGPIAAAAAVVGAVLVGMGIDYPVLYLPHYAAARTGGLSAADAVRRTTAALLSPLTAACATSLFGFAAVAFSSVPALRDFAVVGMLGLAGALVAAVTVLPAMLVLTDRGRRTADPRVSVTPVLAWAVSRRRPLLVGWTGLTVIAIVVVAAMPGPVLRMTSDLTAMHPRPNPPLDAARRVAARMGADPGSLTVYLRATSGEQLVRSAYDVDRRLATPAVRAAGVIGTVGLPSLLPDPAVAARRGGDAAAADQVVRNFRAAVAKTSFDPASFEGYGTFLHHLLSGPPVPSVADLAKYPRLAESLLSRHEVAGRFRPGEYEAVTLLLVDRPLDQRADRVAAVSAVRAALADVPGATLTGLGVAGLAAEAAVTRDVPRLVGAAVLLNALYLLVHFRSWRATFWAVGPAGLSLLVMAAVARVGHVEVNLINLVALPLLIGIDVDYGIYLVSLSRGPRAEAARRVSLSGHSVTVSAVANVLGFASLVTTAVPAVRSLGLTVAAGVATCLAATLLLRAPALLPNLRKDVG